MFDLKGFVIVIIGAALLSLSIDAFGVHIINGGILGAAVGVARYWK